MLEVQFALLEDPLDQPLQFIKVSILRKKREHMSHRAPCEDEEEQPEPWALAQVKFRGFRFQGIECYAGQEWCAYEFPDLPSKLYISKLFDNWSNAVYNRARLVDTGGVDMWQGGIDTWHSKVIFMSDDPLVTPVEVNFLSYGRRWRGEGELFDYSQIEVRKASNLHEDNFGDEHWYSFQHTAPTPSLLSYDDIVENVAALAIDYPYFTWDEMGTYEDNADVVQQKNIKNCHCRIFSERVMRQVLDEREAAKLPPDMDRRAKFKSIPRPEQAKRDRTEGHSRLYCVWQVVTSLCSPRQRRSLQR